MGISNFYRRSFGELPAELEMAPREVLMEKAKIVGLESVDLTGNYDRMGLAKRVAFELDRDEEIDDIEGATISQEGKEIIMAADNFPWKDKLRLIERTRQVPGVESNNSIRIFEKIYEVDEVTIFLEDKALIIKDNNCYFNVLPTIFDYTYSNLSKITFNLYRYCKEHPEDIRCPEDS